MSDKIIQTEAEYIAQHRAKPDKYWRGSRDFLESMKRGEQNHRIREAYLKRIKKLIKQGVAIPGAVLAQRPEYQKAKDDYERYLKARHTSHANESVGVVDFRELLGYKFKRQDGKRLTESHLWDIENGVVGTERVIPGIRDAMRQGNLTLVHTNGRHPFLSQFGGTYMPSERTINVGIKIDGIPVRALAHELGHWLDYEGHGTEEGEIAVSGCGRRGKHVRTRCYTERTEGGAELVRRALNDMNASIREHHAMMRKLFPLVGEKSALTLEEQVTKVRVGRYWKRPTEVFARLTEQYVATKLDRDSAAAESPLYYQKHSFYWDAKRFDALIPLIEARINEAAEYTGTCDRNEPAVAEVSQKFDDLAEAHNEPLEEEQTPRKADRDTAPRLPISICMSVEGNKLTAVRVSSKAAAKISRVRGFPHYDLSREEKNDKLRKLLDYDYSRMIRRKVVKQVTHFNPLASSYFPHMWGVRAGDKRTPLELFADNNDFPKAMGKRGKLRERSKQEREEEKNLPNIFGAYLTPAVLTRSSVQKALRTYSGTQGVSNFSPVAASAIYHKLLPEEGGVVWDPSCGWGGRLLGAVACPKVHKYIGCDPGVQTYKGLMRMRGELLPLARAMGRDLEVEMHMLGSETKEVRDALPKGGVWVVFSSPPYFSQEIYSDEPTQSWKKFPTKEAWLAGFMGATLDNCEWCLKADGVLAINIADVSSHPTLAREVVEYAGSHGWKLTETMNLALSSIVGNTKHKNCGECQRVTGEVNGIEAVTPTFDGKWKKCSEHKYKYEPIYIFKRRGE